MTGHWGRAAIKTDILGRLCIEAGQRSNGRLASERSQKALQNEDG
jgi:hypothetical protein